MYDTMLQRRHVIKLEYLMHFGGENGFWSFFRVVLPSEWSFHSPDTDDDVVLMCQKMKNFPVCETSQSSAAAS